MAILGTKVTVTDWKVSGVRLTAAKGSTAVKSSPTTAVNGLVVTAGNGLRTLLTTIVISERYWFVGIALEIVRVFVLGSGVHVNVVIVSTPKTIKSQD